MNNSNDHQEDDDEWVSKTRRKKEMHYRQALGEKLITLKPEERATLNLPAELEVALEEATRMKKNEALRRHRQYIGKLMRDIDLEPIETYFEQRDSAHQLNTRAFHELEDLRDKLIAGDNNDIGDVIARFPLVDKQKLRQLVRNAKKEQQINESQGTTDNKQGRALFRFLRQLQEESA
ncbi:MAG: ribosome biogenesis factor YjgA [Ketobacteraceae bacterium]|nr:ribosome biogenesis factor YjgA [Ketobacteraceae bacterium]